MDATSDPAFMTEVAEMISIGETSYESLAHLVKSIQPSRAVPFMSVVNTLVDRNRIAQRRTK
jgi:hypothetical protein